MACLKKFSVFVLLLIIIVGCERKGEHIPTAAITGDLYLENGWTQYESGNYEAAIENFILSKARDATKEDVYNGLGWGYTKMENYEEASSNFLLLLSLTDSDEMKADIYAGLAMLHSAIQLSLDQRASYDDSLARIEEGLTAINYANMVFELDPDYQFSHDEHINVNTMHAMIAQCYFNMQNFIRALNEVETYLDTEIRQNFITDGFVTNKLDTVIVTTAPETEVTGALDVSLENAQLVDVISVKNLETNILYNVVEYVQGGYIVTISGNPVPQDNENYLIEYQNAVDYGLFLNELINTIVQYQ